MNLKPYWEKALTPEDYIALSEERAQNNPNPNDPYQEYYELGLQRMQRILKTFKLDEEQLKTLKEKNFNGKILIISESWCGDASTTVPAVFKFFEGHNEVRIFLRDRDESLINQFLTNGSKSIPLVIILDENDEALHRWGPRPAYGTELLAKYKANPEAYPKESFYNDLQVYYAKNKGKDAIEEILNLI